MVRKWSKTARTLSGNDQETSGNGQKCGKSIQDGQKMFKNCQEMLRIGPGNGQDVRKWSGNVRKWSENFQKWSEMIRILSKIDKKTKKRGEIHLVYVQPERRRREGWQ